MGFINNASSESINWSKRTTQGNRASFRRITYRELGGPSSQLTLNAVIGFKNLTLKKLKEEINRPDPVTNEPSPGYKIFTVNDPGDKDFYVIGIDHTGNKHFYNPILRTRKEIFSPLPTDDPKVPKNDSTVANYNTRFANNKVFFSTNGSLFAGKIKVEGDKPVYKDSKLIYEMGSYSEEISNPDSNHLSGRLKYLDESKTLRVLPLSSEIPKYKLPDGQVLNRVSDGYTDRSDKRLKKWIGSFGDLLSDISLIERHLDAYIEYSNGAPLTFNIKAGTEPDISTNTVAMGGLKLVINTENGYRVRYGYANVLNKPLSKDEEYLSGGDLTQLSKDLGRKIVLSDLKIKSSTYWAMIASKYSSADYSLGLNIHAIDTDNNMSIIILRKHQGNSSLSTWEIIDKLYEMGIKYAVTYDNGSSVFLYHNIAGRALFNVKEADKPYSNTVGYGFTIS